MIKTPKISDVTDNIVNGLTLVGGAMASRGVVSYIPEKHQTAGKAGVALGSIAVASALKGNSRGISIGKLALMGVAAMQLIDLATDVAKKNMNPTNISFVDKALGLKGCGCQQTGLGNNFQWPGFLSAPADATGIETVSWEPVEEFTNFEEVTAASPFLS